MFLTDIVSEANWELGSGLMDGVLILVLDGHSLGAQDIMLTAGRIIVLILVLDGHSLGVSAGCPVERKDETS